MAGKLRSRNNAIRHGLASHIGKVARFAQDIDRLAKSLAESSNSLWRNELTRAIAECSFDLQRIRAARTEVLRRVGEVATPKEHADVAAAVEGINRYERRVLSKRRKILKILAGVGSPR